MRIRDPKTTALIFASGKMVVTGAKSEDDSRLASRKYARIVQKLGFDAKFSEFKIQNIVGSCDVKFPIRLEGLAYSHGQFSSYEPEVCTCFAPLSAKVNRSSAALPWLDLPYDQAQGRASYLRVWQDRLDWCKGKVSTPYAGLPPSSSRDVPLPVVCMVTNIVLSLATQVREEIYTAFNTIYTVLVEFRKP